MLIISIDGLRPDKALQANILTLRAMLQQGSYPFWARTTADAITLPPHTSMLTGVTPRKHGIEWNVDLPLSKPVYPRVLTLMEMATRAGYVTAMIAGKNKFDTLNKPGTITRVYVPAKTTGTNDEVVVAAEKIIAADRPGVTFLHLADVDVAGHRKGWGSPEQMAAIETTEGHLACIFAALEAAGMRASTLVLLTADHGGAGISHGADDPRSRHIPWVVVGPGVRKNFDLTQIEALEVRTEDTCATACWLLGLPLPAYFESKPVREAFTLGL